jgi:hypothetical protein
VCHCASSGRSETHPGATVHLNADHWLLGIDGGGRGIAICFAAAGIVSLPDICWALVFDTVLQSMFWRASMSAQLSRVVDLPLSDVGTI